MYTFDSRVRFSEVGEDKRLTLNGIIDYFQDCSTFQSEDLGNGLEAVEKLHRVWVLSFWQIVVEEYPKLGESITTGTWPYDFRSFLGSRNFVMKNKDGKMLAYANSLWTYLNTDTGRPVRVDPEILELYTLEPKLSMEYADRKIPVPEAAEPMEAFHIAVQHLDTNHHVNNGQYVQMAANYLPKDFEVAQMRAEYRKSAVLGDEICPAVSKEPGKVVVCLNDTAGRPYTIVEFTDRREE